MKYANRVSTHIMAKRGVPNFFGIQRFGIIRPVTHLVGKYIIAKEFENAVMSYAANPIQGETSLSFSARQFLEETRDFVGALKRLPHNMQFERILVNHLAVHQDDWVGALGRLPLNLLRMFVHAYQSYIFNRILSRRIKKNMPLQEAVVGDVVIPVERLDRMQDRGIEVTNRNLDKVNRQIVKGNCYPTAPLIGYKTQLARGAMGDIEQAIFDEEQIDPSKFQVHGFPQLASQGIRRMVMSPVTNLRLSFQDQKLFLAFSLKKGSYATSLLREFMKSPIMNY
jgi:tRNA pseudouridine13 synthase